MRGNWAGPVSGSDTIRPLTIMKESSKMATETLTRDEIDNAGRTLAIRTLGIDLESYKQAIVDAIECKAALALLIDQLTDRDRGLALLLRGVDAHLESVADELRVTGRAMGIEAA